MSSPYDYDRLTAIYKAAPKPTNSQRKSILGVRFEFERLDQPGEVVRGFVYDFDEKSCVVVDAINDDGMRYEDEILVLAYCHIGPRSKHWDDPLYAVTHA